MGVYLYEDELFPELMEEKRDYELVSAALLGKQMKSILRANSTLCIRIKTILENCLYGYTPDEIDNISGADYTNDLSGRLKELKMISEIIRALK